MKAKTGTQDLTELDDVALITAWALARHWLILASKSGPDREAVKARYDALALEYRSRVEGSEA